MQQRRGTVEEDGRASATLSLRTRTRTESAVRVMEASEDRGEVVAGKGRAMLLGIRDGEGRCWAGAASGLARTPTKAVSGAGITTAGSHR